MFKLALPNKGRLSSELRSVLEAAGYRMGFVGERSLTAELSEGVQALFVRAADIPSFVQSGAADAGLTGHDCVLESGHALREELDLELGACRLVVAVPRAEAQGGLEALPARVRVATSFPRSTRAFFEARGKQVDVVTVSGATEITPQLGVADAIVDLVATGSTLRQNGLTEVATITTSTVRLVTQSAPLSAGKASVLEEIAFSIASVIRARGKRYLMANVPRDKLGEVREVLPGLSGPTLVEVGGGDGPFLAAHAVVDERDVNRTALRLKALGAEGILVTRIERLVP